MNTACAARNARGRSGPQARQDRCAPLAITVIALIVGALLSVRADAQSLPNTLTLASWSFSSAQAMAQFWEKARADIVAFRELENREAAEKIFPRAIYDVHTTSGSFRSRTGFAIRNNIAYTANDDVAALGLTASQAPSLTPAADITVYVNGSSIRLLAVHLYPGCIDRRLYLDGKHCGLLRRQAIAVAGWIATRNVTRTPFIVLGDFGRVLSDDDEIWRLINLGEDDNIHRLPSNHVRACNGDQFE